MANKEYKFVDNYGFNETLLKEAFAEARKIYKERDLAKPPPSPPPIWQRHG